MKVRGQETDGLIISLDGQAVFHAMLLTSANIGHGAAHRLASGLEIGVQPMAQQVCRYSHGRRDQDSPRGSHEVGFVCHRLQHFSDLGQASQTIADASP